MVNGDTLVQGKPYEQLEAGSPPIPITIAPPPLASAQLGIHPSQRSRTSPEASINGSTPPSCLRDDVRRDSGLAPSASTAITHTTLATDVDSANSVKEKPSILRSLSYEGRTSSFSKFRKWSGQRNRHSQASKELPRTANNFEAITTSIPSSTFEDFTSPGKVEFSKRGSMLISGERVSSNGATMPQIKAGEPRRQPSVAHRTGSTVSLPTNVPSTISSEDEILSQKVRSLYEDRTGRETEFDYPAIEEESQEGDVAPRNRTFSSQTYLSASNVSIQRNPSCTTTGSHSDAASMRDEFELAGGIEDWQDVDIGDVDRYGFIIPRRPTSTTASPSRGASPDPPRLQRVSTLLQLASEAPRRNRSSAIRRNPSAHGSARSAKSPNSDSPTKRNARPPSSQASYTSSISRPPSRIRSVANRLPYNRDRRTMDEAADMLTLPPGLADIAEDDAVDSRHADFMKRREREREEKWRRMARQVGSNKHGSGMVFEFDTRSSKLISRTWKGIPDRWRATAWHAFLSASAKRRGIGLSDKELIKTFQDLLDQNSPDDVQIDIDVPRTISSHIMFRRRYRGGQRLLFRVLHCLSIYFPETGYVQGMAALAAMVLCYYEEAMAFVMLVRMWELRGMKRLYQSGFEGLMEALEEFEKEWLVGGTVVENLVCFHLQPTTRCACAIVTNVLYSGN